MKNGKILLRICLLILVTSTIASFWAISTPVTPQMTAQAAVSSNLPDSCGESQLPRLCLPIRVGRARTQAGGSPSLCENYAACCVGQYCATLCSPVLFLYFGTTLCLSSCQFPVPCGTDTLRRSL